MFDYNKILILINDTVSSVEELFILSLLKEDTELLKIYLKKSKHAEIYLKILEKKEYIKIDKEIITLTDKAYKEAKLPVNIQVSLEFVDQFRNLFPEGVRTSGYLVRGDKKGCLKKLQKFFKDNPHISKEEVLQATKNYIKRSEQQFYEKLQLAHNFIEKNGVSTLLSEVESLSNTKKASSFPSDYVDEI